MLRALMKRKELDRISAELEEVRNTINGFEAREAEIASMIEEAETEEERSAVEEEIDKFEAEKRGAEEKAESLEEKVGEIEAELEELEKNQEDPEPEAAPEEPEERGNENMKTRNVFANFDEQKRNAIFAQEDVKAFLGEVRSAMREKRAIQNVGLTIPEVFLGMIRENIMEYSKLYKHVFLRPISGKGREIVEGTFPEAVWTECCANVNELAMIFNDVEVDCFTVAGYIPVCRASLDDSDIDLAGEIVTALGASIGLALDKAILYGTGTRMPEGIVTRLAQTSKPAGYSDTERAWVDLHTTNIKKLNATGADLFKAILTTTAAAKGKYSRGVKVWCMNETTYNYLLAEGLSFNAAGAIVSGMNGAMPVVGGVVEVLDFIPDYDVVGGYFDLYLLAEREGITFDQSDHVMFLSRKRVYLAEARYDGKPVIAEGFVLFDVKNTNRTTEITFAADTANAVSGS